MVICWPLTLRKPLVTYCTLWWILLHYFRNYWNVLERTSEGGYIESKSICGNTGLFIKRFWHAYHFLISPDLYRLVNLVCQIVHRRMWVGENVKNNTQTFVAKIIWHVINSSNLLFQFNVVLNYLFLTICFLLVAATQTVEHTRLYVTLLS